MVLAISAVLITIAIRAVLAINAIGAIDAGITVLAVSARITVNAVSAVSQRFGKFFRRFLIKKKQRPICYCSHLSNKY